MARTKLNELARELSGEELNALTGGAKHIYVGLLTDDGTLKPRSSKALNVNEALKGGPSAALIGETFEFLGDDPAMGM